MKVIVAGYPKTGTKSMDAALTELGYNVYDVNEHSILLEDEYTKIFKEGWMTEDFRKMYENVDAVTDIPACFFWDEIHKAYPDAKIILTIREDEDIWCRSLKGQLEAERATFRTLRILSPTIRRIFKHVIEKTYNTVMGITYPSIWSTRVKINEEMAKKFYRSHNSYVMQSAPKDKLLVFKCSEGWKPLCEFLDLPIPTTPFPHKNIKGNLIHEMDKRPIFKNINKEVLRTTIAIYVVTAGVVTYCSFKYGPITMVREGCNYLKTFFEKTGC